VLCCGIPERRTATTRTIPGLPAFPAIGGLVHAAEPARPLRVASVTGGCCHDSEGQKKILVARSASDGIGVTEMFAAQ
jgi:hypothetical protein